MIRFLLLSTFVLLATALSEEAVKRVEDIVNETKPSLVSITHSNREGQSEREGTGFIIDSEQGLIATNFHVIGDARPITVTTSSDHSLNVTQVYASDRKLDLAILKVSEKDLPALPLGDSADLPDGLPIVAMGNPQGLRFSVVEGIISAKRDESLRLSHASVSHSYRAWEQWWSIA